MEAMHPDVDHILFTEEEITAMVKRVGAQISEDYKDKDLVLIAVLRGAVVFMGDPCALSIARLPSILWPCRAMAMALSRRASFASSKTSISISSGRDCPSSRIFSTPVSPLSI